MDDFFKDCASKLVTIVTKKLNCSKKVLLIISLYVNLEKLDPHILCISRLVSTATQL